MSEQTQSSERGMVFKNRMLIDITVGFLSQLSIIHLLNQSINFIDNMFDFQALAKRLWGDTYYNAKT